MTSPTTILDEDFAFGDDAPGVDAVPGFTPATNAGAPIPPIGTSAAGAQTQPTSGLSATTIIVVVVIIGVLWYWMKRRKR